MEHYLDNSATTRVCPEAAEAALRAMTEVYGNPSSTYTKGREAKALLDASRRQVADALGCEGSTDEEKFEALIAKIDALKAAIGIKPTIRDYVEDENAFLETLDQMVEQAFGDQCTGANPRYPLMSEIKQMYLNAYYGKNKETV